MVYRVVQKNSCIFEFSLPTSAHWLRQPMHSPSALTELSSPNLAGTFSYNPVHKEVEDNVLCIPNRGSDGCNHAPAISARPAVVKVVLVIASTLVSWEWTSRWYSTNFDFFLCVRGVYNQHFPEWFHLDGILLKHEWMSGIVLICTTRRHTTLMTIPLIS